MRRRPPAAAGAGPIRRQVAGALRDGMTLLEVLVSLAIFLLSLVAIGRLISLSSERAREVQLQGEAMLLCQSKMAEFVAGVEQLSSQSDVAFAEDPTSTWVWSADCNQGQVANLWTVQVRVSKQRADGSHVEVSLSQMVLDPSVRGTSIPSTSTSGTSGSGTSAGGS